MKGHEHTLYALLISQYTIIVRFSSSLIVLVVLLLLYYQLLASNAAVARTTATIIVSSNYFQGHNPWKIIVFLPHSVLHQQPVIILKQYQHAALFFPLWRMFSSIITWCSSAQLKHSASDEHEQEMLFFFGIWNLVCSCMQLHSSVLTHIFLLLAQQYFYNKDWF